MWWRQTTLVVHHRVPRLGQAVPRSVRLTASLKPKLQVAVVRPFLSSAHSRMAFKYPNTRRDETVVENLHGVNVADPYRWLEDPDSAETSSFVDAQNKITFDYLAQSPIRPKFHARLTKLFDYEKYSCPFKRGLWSFYFYNTGLQAQSVLYKSIDGKIEELLNPNTLSTDGTVSLSTYGFTEDGTYLAYALSQSGSDWVTIYVKNVATGEVFNDKIEWVKFSGVSWTHDNKGFFYSRYPKPASVVEKDKAGTETETMENHKLYYHQLGTSQQEDILIHSDPLHPQWLFGGEVSDDGEYLLMTISESTDPVNRLYIARLNKTEGITGSVQFTKVVDNFEAQYEYVTNEGTRFYFKTNKLAPKYKVVSLDFSDPSKPAEFVDVIAETSDPLQTVRPIDHNKLIVGYLHHVKDTLQLHDLETGKLIKNFPLEIGTISGLTGRKQDKAFFYQHVSFLSPGVIYHYDFATDASTVFREAKIEGFDRTLFNVEQVFYKSKDGTEIPMFILSRKDLKYTGENPTFLYGYGGFDISITPSFSVSRIIFVQNMKGVLAVANIRGGGEYGEEWHKSGTLSRKQNCFDDFMAAADYLIERGITKASKICINGGSNGGLLVGACITQRPDLFGAAIADVGVLDMLRFHKFSIGYFWKTDYGDPDKKEDFEYIYKYSPLHNIRPGIPYPSVMLTTGDHDDRVVPLHSFKMIAELQHVLGNRPEQKNPLLIRIEKKAGHGAGKPTAKIIEETTDRFSFVGLALDATWSDD